MCVCFPYSGTSRNRVYKQQYQRLQRDMGMKYKMGFFLKTLCSEVMASFAYRESRRRHSSTLELAFSLTEYSKVVLKANGGLRTSWNTSLDIRQKARVLWQSLSLLSQCSEHLTIPHNFHICSARTCARGIPRELNGYTDVVFAPHTYCRLLASFTYFMYIIIINPRRTCAQRGIL